MLGSVQPLNVPTVSPAAQATWVLQFWSPLTFQSRSHVRSRFGSYSNTALASVATTGAPVIVRPSNGSTVASAANEPATSRTTASVNAHRRIAAANSRSSIGRPSLEAGTQKSARASIKRATRGNPLIAWDMRNVSVYGELSAVNATDTSAAAVAKSDRIPIRSHSDRKRGDAASPSTGRDQSLDRHPRARRLLP